MAETTDEKNKTDWARIFVESSRELVGAMSQSITPDDSDTELAKGLRLWSSFIDSSHFRTAERVAQAYWKNRDLFLSARVTSRLGDENIVFTFLDDRALIPGERTTKAGKKAASTKLLISEAYADLCYIEGSVEGKASKAKLMLVHLYRMFSVICPQCDLDIIMRMLKNFEHECGMKSMATRPPAGPSNNPFANINVSGFVDTATEFLGKFIPAEMKQALSAPAEKIKKVVSDATSSGAGPQQIFNGIINSVKADITSEEGNPEGKKAMTEILDTVGGAVGSLMKGAEESAEAKESVAEQEPHTE